MVRNIIVPTAQRKEKARRNWHDEGRLYESQSLKFGRALRNHVFIHSIFIEHLLCAGRGAGQWGS